MDLSRISSRTYLRIILGLVAFILIAFFLNKLHTRWQSYEGVVVRIHWIRAFWRPPSVDVLLARVQTPDGRQLKADVTHCPAVSKGAYVVKRRGSYCPTVVKRERDLLRSKGIRKKDVPLPRRNPDLTRQLREYEEAR